MQDLFTLAMDRESLFKLGLTACAVGISCFILWGPKLGSKRSPGAGALIGLENLGLTCFLNSLLQAIASCPAFIEWLEKHRGFGRVSDSLLSVLRLLCYERDENNEFSDETFSPRELIAALSAHGWSIAPQEQDAHELFLLLITTLEEEEQKTTKESDGSLLDALDIALEPTSEESPPPASSHGDLTASSPAIISRSEPKIISSHGDHKMSPPSSGHLRIKPQASPFRGSLTSQLQCMRCNYKSPLTFDKFDCLSLPLPSTESTVPLTKLLDFFVKPEVLNDFACEACNKGSSSGEPTITSKAIKTVKIGKLPKCLCLHISRTHISPEGYVFKKENHVDFPEFLPMGSYTHNSYLKNQKVTQKLGKKTKFLSKSESNGVNSDPTLTMFRLLSEGEEVDNNQNPSEGLKLNLVNKVTKNGVLDLIDPSGGKKKNNSPKRESDPEEWKHLYRLKAVVEHKGTVDGGHFVTYRKGPLQSQNRHRSSESHSRWFYTSDAEIRKSSMSDAMHSKAYMLFYELCPHAGS